MSSSTSSWIEIPVFIHGITPEADPDEPSHEDQYGALYQNINQALESRGKEPFKQPYIGVEWGWDSGQSEEEDRKLARAEQIAGGITMEELNDQRDWPYNPLRLLYNPFRRAFLYGFADMFYYVSHDGEHAVRNHVFTHLCDKVEQRFHELDQAFSLTFIAHSAGTVIAHDLLYHLFREQDSPVADEVNLIRKRVSEGDVRVRQFYTMGSPITPLMFRSDSLMDKVCDAEQIDPASLGLKPSDEVSDPRWVNFWDKDDIISYPVSSFYGSNGDNAIVEDRYVDLGYLFPRVHTRYWESEKLAQRIAETF